MYNSLSQTVHFLSLRPLGIPILRLVAAQGLQSLSIIRLLVWFFLRYLSNAYMGLWTFTSPASGFILHIWFT